MIIKGREMWKGTPESREAMTDKEHFYDLWTEEDVPALPDDTIMGSLRHLGEPRYSSYGKLLLAELNNRPHLLVAIKLAGKDGKDF